MKHAGSAGRPRSPLLAENNAREGFLEVADFEVVAGHLREYLQDFDRFAYLGGWHRGGIRALERQRVTAGRMRGISEVVGQPTHLAARAGGGWH